MEESLIHQDDCGVMKYREKLITNYGMRLVDDSNVKNNKVVERNIVLRMILLPLGVACGFLLLTTDIYYVLCCLYGYVENQIRCVRMLA